MDFCPSTLIDLAEVGRGKGMGMVALQNIPTGTVICSEFPLLVLNGSDVGVRDICETGSRTEARKKYERGPALLQAQFEVLTLEKQALVGELWDSMNEAELGAQRLLRLASQKLTGLSKEAIEEIFSSTGGLPAGKSLWGIFQSNAIPQGEQNAQGLYQTICRFNHSCVPNAIYQWRASLGTNVVVTTRAVDVGEEVCVSYFKSMFMTHEERRTRTMMSWGFECKCADCDFEVPPAIEALRDRTEEMSQMTDAEYDALEAAIPPEQLEILQKRQESSMRRNELWKLEQNMERASSVAQGRRLLSRMRALFEQEAMLPNLKIEQKLVRDELNLVTIYSPGDLAACRAATKQLYEVTLALEGVDGDGTAKYKRWMDSERGAPTEVEFMGVPGLHALETPDCRAQ